MREAAREKERERMREKRRGRGKNFAFSSIVDLLTLRQKMKSSLHAFKM